MFWQFSKQSFYLPLRKIFILKINNYEFVMHCEAQYDENKFDNFEHVYFSFFHVSLSYNAASAILISYV